MTIRSFPESGPFLIGEKQLQKGASPTTPILLGVCILLVALGLINLYSAASAGYYFWAQVKYSIIGISAMLIVGWFISPKFIKHITLPYYIAIVISLIIVLLAGHSAGGAQRWINLGFIKIQPSEFSKIAAACIGAYFFLNNRQPMSYNLRDLSPLLLKVGLLFLLIFKQPDLGTASIPLFILVAQLFFVKIEKRSILFVASTGLSLVFVAWNFFLHDYQKLRVLNLLNPERDPFGSGYNSLQSLVAIGSGQVYGKGFLQGTQTQLAFLPARHTDFVFSVFSEEHGFIGGLSLFLLFGVLCYLGILIAKQSKDIFSSMLAIGVSTIIFVEMMINTAMVLAIFPVVGMPLPFFSFGGSSMLTVCLCIGILISIDRNNNGHKFKHFGNTNI